MIAEEDMKTYLIDDFQGRSDVDKKAKELRTEAKVRQNVFREQAVQFHGGLVGYSSFTMDFSRCF